jgi:RNA polymerase sigma-70 factor (ECF subfamily)
MESVETLSPDAAWLEWMRRIASGDEAALGALYDASSRLVYGLALRILGDAGTAEDVTLDVYMQVWRQAGRFDPARGRVSTWLLTMARSRAIDRLRDSQLQHSKHETLEVLADFEGGEPDPEESAAMAQKRARVQVALNSLTPDQRRAISLAFFGGLSQTEIASKLNEPLGTVKTRIRSGMLKLREILGPYAGGLI